MAVQGKLWLQLMFGGISLCWEESQILPLKAFGTAEEKRVLLGRRGGGHCVHRCCVRGKSSRTSRLVIQTQTRHF